MNRIIKFTIAALAFAAFGVRADVADHWTYDASAGTITDGAWTFAATAFDDGLRIGRYANQTGPGNGNIVGATVTVDFSKPVYDANSTQYPIRCLGTTSGNRLFNGSNVSKVILPSTLTRLEDYCFDSCSLADVEPLLPQSLVYIGQNAFNNRQAVTRDVTVYVQPQANGLKAIGSKRAVFECDIDNLQSYTFQNNPNLEWVEFKGNINNLNNANGIGQTAKLKTIYFHRFPTGTISVNWLNSNGNAAFPVNLTGRILLDATDPDSSGKMATWLSSGLTACDADETAAYREMFPDRTKLLGKKELWNSKRTQYIATTVAENNDVAFSDVAFSPISGGMRVSYTAAVTGSAPALSVQAVSPSGVVTRSVTAALASGSASYDITGLDADTVYEIRFSVDYGDDSVERFDLGTVYTGEIALEGTQDMNISTGAWGVFTASLGEGADAAAYDIVLPFSVSGSAVDGTDYVAPAETAITIHAGKKSAKVSFKPLINEVASGASTITLTLAAGGYTLDPASDTISVAAVTANSWWTYTSAENSDSGVAYIDDGNWRFPVSVFNEGLRVDKYNKWKKKYGSPTEIDFAKPVYDGTSTIEIVALNTQFMQDTSATVCKLPEHLLYIESSAFDQANQIQTITPFLPESVAFIGANAFKSRTSLLDCDLELGHPTINGSAFEGVTHLKSVVLGDGTVLNGNAVFANCYALESAVFKGRLYLYAQTFRYCTGLKEVVFEQFPHTLGNDPFSNNNGSQAFSGDLTARIVVNPADDSALKTTYLSSVVDCSAEEEAAYHDMFTDRAVLLGKRLMADSKTTRAVYVCNMAADVGSVEFADIALSKISGGYQVDCNATVKGGPFPLYLDIITSAGTTQRTLTQTLTSGAQSFDILNLPEDSTCTLRFVVDFGGGSLESTDIGSVYTGEVTLTATTDCDINHSQHGVFTVTRGDSAAATARDLEITYTITGTAEADVDYTALSGTVTIPAGGSVATIDVKPLVNPNAAADGTTLTLQLYIGGAAVPGATATVALPKATDYWYYANGEITRGDYSFGAEFYNGASGTGIKVKRYTCAKNIFTTVDFSVPVYDGADTYDILALDSQFMYQATVTAVTLPPHLEVIYGNAFDQCNLLTTVTPLLPDSLIAVNTDNFKNRYSLTGDLTLNLSPMPSMFYNTRITSVVLGEHATRTYNDCFNACSELVSVKMLAPNISYIDQRSFAGCSKLKDIYFESIPAGNDFRSNTFDGNTFAGNLTARVVFNLANANAAAWVAKNVTAADAEQQAAYAELFPDDEYALLGVAVMLDSGKTEFVAAKLPDASTDCKAFITGSPSDYGTVSPAYSSTGRVIAKADFPQTFTAPQYVEEANAGKLWECKGCKVVAVANGASTVTVLAGTVANDTVSVELAAADVLGVQWLFEIAGRRPIVQKPGWVTVTELSTPDLRGYYTEGATVRLSAASSDTDAKFVRWWTSFNGESTLSKQVLAQTELVFDIPFEHTFYVTPYYRKNWYLYSNDSRITDDYVNLRLNADSNVYPNLENPDGKAQKWVDNVGFSFTCRDTVDYSKPVDGNVIITRLGNAINNQTGVREVCIGGTVQQVDQNACSGISTLRDYWFYTRPGTFHSGWSTGNTSASGTGCRFFIERDDWADALAGADFIRWSNCSSDDKADYYEIFGADAKQPIGFNNTTAAPFYKKAWIVRIPGNQATTIIVK